MKQYNVHDCASAVSQREAVRSLLPSSDALQGAILGRAGLGLGTRWSHVDFGTFFRGPCSALLAGPCGRGFHEKMLQVGDPEAEES